MTKYYLGSNQAFYDDRLHNVIPNDALPISDALFDEVMTNRPASKILATDANGLPCLLDPGARTLPELAAEKLAQLNAQSQAIADQLTAGYPEFEKLTWEDQRREAFAWSADNTIPTPYIDVLAAERGIGRVDYLQRTIAKATAFAAAAQKLVGQRQKYEDKIKAATSQAELDAIVPVFNLGDA